MRRPLQFFFAYLKANKEPLPTQPHDLEQIGHYLEELWWDGQSKSLAGDTFSSLQHREPSLKRQLRWSWKLFKAWQQAEIPSRAPPFTLQTLAIFCGWAHSTKRWGCKWLFMVYYEQVSCCKYQQSTLRASSSISVYIWGRQRRRFEMPMLTRFILRIAKSHFFCRHGNQ